MLVAGDLYEHDRISVAPDTRNFLRDQFAGLDPIAVFVAPGNHDWFGPRSLYRLVEWSPNVTIFTGSRLEAVELEDGLTLWGAAHSAPAGTPGFLEGFSVDRGGTHLALFHGSERSGFPFQEEGKEPHAPFTVEEIQQAGLSHAFVGHYHVPKDGTSHTYPGNPEPLSFGEDGSRGVVLAEVLGDGSVRRERVVVSGTRVWDREIDVTGCTSSHEIIERVRSDISTLSGYVRLTLRGSYDPASDLRLSDVEAAFPEFDAVVARMDSLYPDYDMDLIGQEPTVKGQFVRDVTQAPLDEALRRRVLITGLRALEGREDLEVIQ